MAKNKDKTINWKLWLKMGKVKIWVAIALSISTNPENITTKFHNNKTRIKNISASQEIVDEFELRWQQFHGSIALNFYDDFTEEVNFVEFIDWASHTMKWTLPKELARFLKKNLGNKPMLSPTPPRKRGRPSLLTPENVSLIKDFQHRNPEMTQQQLSDKTGFSRTLVRKALNQ